MGSINWKNAIVNGTANVTLHKGTANVKRFKVDTLVESVQDVMDYLESATDNVKVRLRKVESGAVEASNRGEMNPADLLAEVAAADGADTDTLADDIQTNRNGAAATK